jgi:hypothetical protein
MRSLRTHAFSVAPCLSLFLYGCGSSNADGTAGLYQTCGTGTTVTYYEPCASCAAAKCGGEITAALGVGWRSANFSGGSCEEGTACICACENDKACISKCSSAVSTACVQANAAMGACTKSKCTDACIGGQYPIKLGELGSSGGAPRDAVGGADGSSASSTRPSVDVSACGICDRSYTCNDGLGMRMFRSGGDNVCTDGARGFELHCDGTVTYFTSASTGSWVSGETGVLSIKLPAGDPYTCSPD